MNKKKSLPECKLVLSPTSKGRPWKPAAATPQISVEPVRDEEIIHINDDHEPSQLQRMQQQVNNLLMPPPVAPAPHAQRPSIPPRHDRQPFNLPKRQGTQGPAQKKKSLAKCHCGRPSKLTLNLVAKMGTGPVDVQQQQKLAQLASAVIPLQKLNLEEEETHVIMPRDLPTSPEEPKPTVGCPHG